MKLKNIWILTILVFILAVCIIPMFPLVSAKATKTQFTGQTTWAGGDAFTDRIAGMTTHRRMRKTYFSIASENVDLDGTTLVRIVNFNRNDKRNSIQRWGKFEIMSGDVVLWSGSWRGNRLPESVTVEDFVGHGVRDDLIGLSIRFTLTTGNIFGTILNPNK